MVQDEKGHLSWAVTWARWERTEMQEGARAEGDFSKARLLSKQALASWPRPLRHFSM